VSHSECVEPHTKGIERARDNSKNAICKEKMADVKNIQKSSQVVERVQRSGTDQVKVTHFEKLTIDYSDVTVVGAKLNEFLDSFVLSYQDLMDEPNVKINLDKIYGDCSEILLNLMDMVERYFKWITN
jgi:hypothetical protein